MFSKKNQEQNQNLDQNQDQNQDVYQNQNQNHSLLTEPNSFSWALVRISLYRVSASLNLPCFR